MNAQNGEVLTSTSFPEYDSETLSLGNDSSLINSYITDKRKFFLDRTVSGLYTPGSIVKPFFALGALAEGIIDPSKKILSTGSISIPNPYFPDQKTVFKDWRANGWTDMGQALAVSSDVYFYTIGGGFGEQKGLGIANIEKYAKLFGIGTATGVDLPDEKGGTIPSPEWKLLNFKGEPWRIGDTYHTAIGQYGFQVTPMEMTRAVGSIANGGTLMTPHFLLGDTQKENQTTSVNLTKEDFGVVRDGMRQAVSYGTAVALNVPYVQVAAKSGTAQLGVNKNKVNSWIMGFFPYENPKYAFTIMMEAGPSTNGVGASSIMRQLLDWMSINTPEYFQ
jgi:penicillin-binding protein 2